MASLRSLLRVVNARPASKELKAERAKRHHLRDFSMCAFSPCWKCVGGPCELGATGTETVAKVSTLEPTGLLEGLPKFGAAPVESTSDDVSRRETD